MTRNSYVYNLHLMIDVFLNLYVVFSIHQTKKKYMTIFLRYWKFLKGAYSCDITKSSMLKKLTHSFVYAWGSLNKKKSIVSHFRDKNGWMCTWMGKLITNNIVLMKL